MLSIINVTNGEPNPLHQIFAEHLDFTFSLGDIAAAIALVVAAITFYISHTQASRHEQIKTSMYMWERINVKYDMIRAESKGWEEYRKSGHMGVPTDMLWSLIREIDYFAHLILSGVVKDEVVQPYYKKYLSLYIRAVLRYYTPPDQRYQVYEEYSYFDELIKKWNINISDEET
jgi:hypothetical protein